MTTDDSDSDGWYRYQRLDDVPVDVPLDREAGWQLDGGEEIYAEPAHPALDRLAEAEIIKMLDRGVDPDTLDPELTDLSDFPPAEGVWTGPPEPIAGDGDDDVVLINPDGTDSPEQITPGEWVCTRCGYRNVVPQADLSDGLTEPQECAGCERQGPFTHVGAGDLPADVNIDSLFTPPWHLPSEINAGGFDDLWDDVENWIRTYWYHPNETHYTVLTGWVITTWLRENLDFLSHICALGSYETGKTRLFNTLSRVAYRAYSPVSTTPSAMYRLVDDLNITFLISEYHDLDQDYRQEVDAVAKGSQKRGETVARTSMGNSDGSVRIFDTFTHVGIGTQFDLADDLKSRSFIIQTKQADRDMPMTFSEYRARELRNRLLYARYRLLHSPEWYQAQIEAERMLDEAGVTDRNREKLLGVVTAGVLWDQSEDIADMIYQTVEQSKRTKHESEDAVVVQAITDATFDVLEDMVDPNEDYTTIRVPYREIISNYERMTGQELEPWKFGNIRKRLGLGAQRYSDGTVLEDENLIPRLKELCDKHQIEWSPGKSASNVSVPEPETDDDDSVDVDDLPTQKKAKVQKVLLEADQPVDVSAVQRSTGLPRDTIEACLTALSEEGRAREKSNGWVNN